MEPKICFLEPGETRRRHAQFTSFRGDADDHHLTGWPRRLIGQPHRGRMAGAPDGGVGAATAGELAHLFQGIRRGGVDEMRRAEAAGEPGLGQVDLPPVWSHILSGSPSDGDGR